MSAQVPALAALQPSAGSETCVARVQRRVYRETLLHVEFAEEMHRRLEDVCGRAALPAYAGFVFDLSGFA